MPCNSEYMESTPREKESRLICGLLTSFHPDVPTWVLAAAEDAYGNLTRVDEATQMLCDVCQSLDESVIYNGRDPMARKLADWWDKHQEWDEKRKAKALAGKKRQNIREQAIAKLTPDELASLDL